MKGIILLNYGENTKQVEEDEKSRFLRDILNQMNVPIEEIWNSDDSLSTEQKIKLRSLLTTYGIQVISNPEDMAIYVEGEKIAEFLKPTYKLKQDTTELDPKKRLYLEMTIDFWSLFDNADEQTDL